MSEKSHSHTYSHLPQAIVPLSLERTHTLQTYSYFIYVVVIENYQSQSMHQTSTILDQNTVINPLIMLGK